MSLGTIYEGGDGASEALTETDRQRYAQLADVLIPDAEGMPSASQAEVHLRWVDQALTARPDLRDGLRQALELSGDLPAEEAVEMINAKHPPVFDALGTLTAGAYFLSPDIRERIGYPGQVPQPIVDDVESYLDLLGNVVERGPIYRSVETPQEHGA
jgi:hypothetical protein